MTTPTTTPTLAEVIAALETAYPPALAEPTGTRSAWCAATPPTRSARCSSPSTPTAADVRRGARDRRTTAARAHHPLLLRGVHGVGARHAEGRAAAPARSAAGARCTPRTPTPTAADPGVSDALAARARASRTRPAGPDPPTRRPTSRHDRPDRTRHRRRVHDALSAAGAGELGDYRECTLDGDRRRTVPAARRRQPDARHRRRGWSAVRRGPRLRWSRRARPEHAVVRALRAAHPYEEPAFDVFETRRLSPARRGLGRVGELPRPQTLRDVHRTGRGGAAAHRMGRARSRRSGPDGPHVSRSAGARATRCSTP